MSTPHYDVAVVGAGIVGLATARELAMRPLGLRVVVIDKEPRVAAHQTGHNSGVIHSGLYYKPGSRKAEMCVAGAAEMVKFCRENGVPHEVCGKVVVATRDDELPRLEELHRRGIANGVPGLRMVDSGELRELEPHAAGIRALHVPTTGIVDYARVAEKYAEHITSSGNVVLTSCALHSATARPYGVTLGTSQGNIDAALLINCAGLHSDRVATMAGADPGVRIVPFRGEYYSIREARRALVRNLIYPVPDPRFPFLGVHFTRRITGEVEAGPNAVLAFAREAYRKSDISLRDLRDALAFRGFWRMAARMWRSGAAEYYRSVSKPAFTRALQRLLPEMREQDLIAGGSGVRAQAITRDGRLVDDFHFAHSGRAIHVLNVPSPAATASLVIGRHIAEIAERALAGSALATS